MSVCSIEAHAYMYIMYINTLNCYIYNTINLEKYILEKSHFDTKS